jgi:excisionase family DNA binding protein
MNFIELKAAFKDTLREAIAEIKAIPDLPELPDRCIIKDACQITGFSKAQIYKMSMEGTIPVEKFGKRLIFSRKGLMAWMQSQTHRKVSPSDQAADNLQATAKKRLK